MRRRTIILIVIILSTAAALWLIPRLILQLGGTRAMNISAWISEPGQQAALSSVRSHGHQLSSVSPMWYKLDERGRFVKAWSGEPRIEESAREEGVLLIPTISNQFDPVRSAHALRSAKSRGALVDGICKAVKDGRYDGVDLDFENLEPADGPKYTLFVKDLKERLASLDAILSVTVQPKTEHSKDWSGVRALDYRALGEIADQIRVMAYDQHYASGPPGPIASISWVEDVVSFSSKRIPMNKLILGVPLYGYDWSGPGQGTAVDKESAEKIARDHGVRIRWDKRAASPFFAYESRGRKHTVWFENARSVRAKLGLGASDRLAGFSFFRLGIEDPEIWKALRARYYPFR